MSGWRARRMVSAWIIAIALAYVTPAGLCQGSGASNSDISGLVRIWGSPNMRAMLLSWEKGFQREYPGVTFDNKLMGTVTAIAGIDHGVADIASMGRDLTTEESMSFEWIYRYKPLQLRVSSGSVESQGQLPALAILVNRQNPLKELNIEQLRLIFGAGGREIMWRAGGLAGTWATKPVHPMGYAFDKGTTAFFRKAVLQNSYQWNCDYHAFSNGRALAKAVADDPNGIAIGTAADANIRVKIVALAASNSGEGVLPTPKSVQQQTYPLSRYAYLIVNRGPGHPLRPVVHEFLHYILSHKGQTDIAEGGGYLPLPNSVALQEEKLLNGPGSETAKKSGSPEE